MTAQDVSEYLCYLKENASELRKCGREWGMTKEEIIACIDDVIANRYNPPPSPKSNKAVARNIWSWVRFGLRIWYWFWLVIFGIILVGSVVSKYLSEPGDSFISTMLRPYELTISSFKFLKHNVSYSDLKRAYEENSVILDSNIHSFESSHSNIREPSDIFREGMEEEIATTKNIMIKWKSTAVFPRLEFIPAESEISLDKVIFIDGPASQEYILSLPSYHNVFYSQSSNERKIILTPFQNCQEHCDKLSVLLEQGDWFSVPLCTKHQFYLMKRESVLDSWAHLRSNDMYTQHMTMAQNIWIVNYLN
ncbi:hypothetical protein KUTeg_023630 [Tegillarca granosa]|uniref:Uncharacterized protein n=1 Tax=Tegillarca granosa TaxID=220873 RepID=A0ABQ9E354_TEGGR|nr:hypothetical protein KUTeg_023630 [Tegillarca granosa]